jgi:hypothetical protein
MQQEVRPFMSRSEELPIPFRPPSREELSQPGFSDLTGCRIGRLIVLGLAVTKSNTHGRPWVVRCDCGCYSTKKGKAIVTESIEYLHVPMCGRCMDHVKLKKKDFFNRYGRWPTKEEELILER